jgi:hypothetical protein
MLEREGERIRPGTNEARIQALCEEMGLHRVAPVMEKITCYVGQGSCIDHVIYGGGSRWMEVRIDDEWLWESDHAKLSVVLDWKTKAKNNNKNKWKKERVFRIEDEQMAKNFGRRVDQLGGRPRWREGQ